MAEYYTVLKKAIGGLGSKQAEPRRTLYDKARNTLLRQLEAGHPPLTTAQNSPQRLQTAEGVRRAAAGGIRRPRPRAAGTAARSRIRPGLGQSRARWSGGRSARSAEPAGAAEARLSRGRRSRDARARGAALAAARAAPHAFDRRG